LKVPHILLFPALSSWLYECLAILSQSYNLIPLTGAMPLDHWRRIRPVTLIAGACATTVFSSLGIDAVKAKK
jgi:hypothetical protein